MQLSFYGGAKTVTGAQYLLEHEGTKLLVDCGLHQGEKFSDPANLAPFSFDPRELSAVVLTHAHMDHSGRLPQLVRAGFRGKIIATAPTADLADLLLIDSEHLLGEEAQERSAAPPYTLEDVEKTKTLWAPAAYHEEIRVGPFSLMLMDAGHILGSASVVIRAGEKAICFSGDLGNSPAPFIRPTEPLADVDYLVVESAYGDRVHEGVQERRDLLEDVIEGAAKAGGVLLIPAFALERTQELLFEINHLVEDGKIPSLPVFLDSPLAIKATHVYQKYSTDPHFFTAASIAALRQGDLLFDFKGLTMTLTHAQSKKIDAVPPPKVVIAGSGMSQGGRIVRHEAAHLSDPHATLLFIGYQAEGSLGRKIFDGAQSVRILGRQVSVQARIKALGGYSAHADQPQILSWLRPRRERLERVFVVQGEATASTVLAQKIKDELAVAADVPSLGDAIAL